MTEKIFYEDAYRKDHEASITNIVEEEGFFKIITDRTIFYPEGGGQSADRGSINGLEVFDVQEKDGVIYHYMKERPQDNIAKMQVDWDRRYDLMQQHSGEHVLSGLILSEYGGNNRGFHMGAETVTIDIDIPKMSWEDLENIEQKVNRKITEDLLVRSETTDRQNLSKYNIRKEISAEGSIRVVTIGDVDCCACCGIHVKSLAEVRMLKILKTEQYKGMTRISFVCGDRAVRDYKKRFDITKKLRQELNTDEDRIPDRVLQIKRDLEQSKQELYGNKKLLAKYVSGDLLQDKNKNVFRFFEDLDYETILHIGDFLEKDVESFVLASKVDGRIIAMTKKEEDLGQVFKEGFQLIGGKGGGKGAKAQATFTSDETQNDFFAFLIKRLGEMK
ncbi:MAG: alanyl-tRNA editing protein [Peptostreptococcaceae bacterium]|nr:alanyl-tRNA editing protein [Peptostreptococcaceae bacterium]